MRKSGRKVESETPFRDYLFGNQARDISSVRELYQFYFLFNKRKKSRNIKYNLRIQRENIEGIRGGHDLYPWIYKYVSSTRDSRSKNDVRRKRITEVI